MKVYEKVLFAKLQPEIIARDLIQPEQNAYKKHRSTLNNLQETFDSIE